MIILDDISRADTIGALSTPTDQDAVSTLLERLECHFYSFKCLKNSGEVGVEAVGKEVQSSSLWIFTPAKTPRTFTSLRGPSRPTIFPSSSVFRPSLAISSPATATQSGVEGTLDLLPKISTHPALGATQIRCGPRNTFSPSHFVRKRRHGFLSRIRTRKGRATLARRRAKKRTTLSH